MGPLEVDMFVYRFFKIASSANHESVAQTGCTGWQPCGFLSFTTHAF